MSHVIAIGGLALMCGLWFVIQRASGSTAEGGAGRCGMCGGDKSNCTNDRPDCER